MPQGGVSIEGGTPAPSIVHIAVYSLAYSEGLVRELPYVPYFVERSLCHLGDLKRPGVRVVLVTPSPISPDILDYHFRDLLGFDPIEERSARERLVQLSPRSQAPRSLADLILNDRELFAALQWEVATADRGLLINVAPSPEIERLATTLGVAVEEGPVAEARRWGSKSGSKELFASTGVPSFRGPSTVRFSIDDVVLAATRLAQSSPPAERVIIKLDDVGWSAGLGNAVVNCRELLQTADLAGAVEAAMQSWETFEAEIPRSGAIVEEYLPGGRCSPSGQGAIDPAGNVTVRATHEQLLDHGHYLGCIYPCQQEAQDQIASVVRRIGEALADRGVHGTFGVDFVGYETGRLLATEVNVRKLAPTHVMACVESVVGDRLSPSGRLEASGLPLSYVHRRLYCPDALVGLVVPRAVAALKRRGLLWNPATKSGALLHILGALSRCGYLETTSVASSPDRAQDLDDEVRNVLLDAGRTSTGDGANRP